MPHVILECSDTIASVINFKQLFQSLHHVLAEKLPTNIANCKSRVAVYDRYFIGEDLCNDFVHITLKIMPGRTLEVKNAVGQQLIAMLKQLLGDHGLKNSSVSCEIVDLSASYFKE